MFTCNSSGTTVDAHFNGIAFAELDSTRICKTCFKTRLIFFFIKWLAFSHSGITFFPCVQYLYIQAPSVCNNWRSCSTSTARNSLICMRYSVMHGARYHRNICIYATAEWLLFTFVFLFVRFDNVFCFQNYSGIRAQFFCFVFLLLVSFQTFLSSLWKLCRVR